MFAGIPGAIVVDITDHGYGPFGPSMFRGVVLHVNQSNGRLEQFFQNSDNVTPNFQAYKNGDLVQYLPVNWGPWCQGGPGGDGNMRYGAIETEGYPDEPLTEPQLIAVSWAVRAYRDLGMPLRLADVPGEFGFGWHGMGGNAWGGHFGCPGDPRKAQRQTILNLISSGATAPATTTQRSTAVAEFVQYQSSVYVADAFTYRGIKGHADYVETLNVGNFAHGGKVRKLNANQYKTLTTTKKRVG